MSDVFDEISELSKEAQPTSFSTLPDVLDEIQDVTDDVWIFGTGI